MNQTNVTTRTVLTRVRTTNEPSNLAKAITAFAFLELTVRPCGHGLPPVLPFRQDDWNFNEILKSELRRNSITDREILRRLQVLDNSRIPYDHIYIGHQDKKSVQIPQKVLDVTSKAIPALATITVAFLTILAAVAVFIGEVVMVMATDPIVVVAIPEPGGSYNLLEIAKWYS